MSNYIIEIVNCKKLEKEFIALPKKLYKDDTSYVSPLDSDINKVFTPSLNKMYEGGEAIRFMIKDSRSGSYAGRIAAFYSEKTTIQGDDKVGGLGFFESINDSEVANMLFDVAIDWLKSHGMTCVDGPINFGDRESWWGLLTEGFTQPIYGMNYNFPYYQDMFESYGFQNYFNGISFKRSFNLDTVNPLIALKAARLSENPLYHFRSIERSEFSQAADWFCEIYTKAWEMFDVAPMSNKDAHKMMGKLKDILDEKLMYFAFYDNKAIGFFIMIPDINPVIKPFNGSLGVVNKLRFLYRLKVKKIGKIAQSLVFGVLPEFQRRGVESGMMDCFSQEILAGKVRYDSLELAWVGDFNPLMINLVQKYVCAVKIKNHITYRYNFDREREFKRAPRVSISRPKKVTTE